MIYSPAIDWTLSLHKAIVDSNVNVVNAIGFLLVSDRMQESVLYLV